MATSVLHGSVAEPKLALRKFTIGEYHKLGDAGILGPNDRVELIDGLLIQMAPIGPEYQFILETLNEIFGMQKKGRFKVGPGRPIPIPDFNEPQPDMVLFKTEGGTMFWSDWKMFSKLLSNRTQRRAGVSVRGDQAQSDR